MQKLIPRTFIYSLETVQGLLQQIQSDTSDPDSRLGRATPSQSKQVEAVVRQIQSVLTNLVTIRDQYQHVERNRKVWDRVRFPREDVRHLQAQLLYFITALNFYLESLSSEMLGTAVRLLEDMAGQNRLVQANWTSLLGALGERGITETAITPHRTEIEDLVHAAQDVAESEHNLAPDSSLRSSTGSTSAPTVDEGTHVPGEDSTFEGTYMEERPYAVGPPSQSHLHSRICEGAVKLQEGRGGIKQKRRLPLFGSAKYRIECTDCKFVGFQDEKLDNLQAPLNTPMFFAERKNKLQPSSLEYHLEVAGRDDSMSDGLYYRTLFFWKCHVAAQNETLHDNGAYECPFCAFANSAGFFYTRVNLIEHILDNHVQNQPSQLIRAKYNCWIGETPMLFKNEYNRVRGRTFDLMLPRPYSDREGTIARIKRDGYVVQK